MDQTTCYDATGKLAPYVMEAACSAILAAPTVDAHDRTAFRYQRAKARFDSAAQMIEGSQNRNTASTAGFADVDELLRAPDLDAATKATFLILKSQGQRMLLPGGDALADATLAEALKVSPDNLNALWERAVSYDERHNYPAAITDWARMAKLMEGDANQKPALSTALNALCWDNAAQLNRDYAAARVYCDRSIALAPGADNYDSRGMVGLREQDYVRAYADYAHAVELAPKNSSPLYGLGIAERRLGRTADGDKHIAEAKAISAKAGDSYTAFGINP